MGFLDRFKRKSGDLAPEVAVALRALLTDPPEGVVLIRSGDDFTSWALDHHRHVDATLHKVQNGDPAAEPPNPPATLEEARESLGVRVGLLALTRDLEEPMAESRRAALLAEAVEWYRKQAAYFEAMVEEVQRALADAARSADGAPTRIEREVNWRSKLAEAHDLEELGDADELENLDDD